MIHKIYNATNSYFFSFNNFQIPFLYPIYFLNKKLLYLIFN